MLPSSKISFQNGRDGIDRRAVGSGCRAENTDRRINREGLVGKSATNYRGANIVPRTKNAPLFVSKKEARAEFSALILPFTVGEIATDADVSNETVKTWRKRRAFPQGQKLMELAFNNQTVQAWVLHKLGANQMPHFRSPEVMDAAIAGIYRLLQENSPDGDAARKAMNRGRT